MFEIIIKDINSCDQVKLVEFIGELTALESTEVSKKLLPLIDKGYINLIGDLSKLEYINSMGVLCLLRCHMRISKHRGTFKLFGVKNDVLKILEEIGMTKLLLIYQTLEEAKESL